MKMKTLRRYTLMLILPAIMFFAGCIQDECTTVKCWNNGVCVNGTCACPYGYEGDFCEDRWYEKFTGAWQVNESDRAGILQQQYTIANVTFRNTDSFMVTGFRNNNDTIVCVRKAFETLTMLAKKFPNGDSLISGEAILQDQGSKVTGLYSLYKDSVAIGVSFTWTK